MEQHGSLRNGRDDGRNSNIRESRKTDNGMVAQLLSLSPIRRLGENKNMQAKRGGKWDANACFRRDMRGVYIRESKGIEISLLRAS